MPPWTIFPSLRLIPPCEGWNGHPLPLDSCPVSLHVCMRSRFSCVWLFATLQTVACQAPLYGDSPGKNTGVGCHALLQGIFLMQGLNLGLLHCMQILFCWATGEGKPVLLAWWLQKTALAAKSQRRLVVWHESLTTSWWGWLGGAVSGLVPPRKGDLVPGGGGSNTGMTEVTGIPCSWHPQGNSHNPQILWGLLLVRTIIHLSSTWTRLSRRLNKSPRL